VDLRAACRRRMWTSVYAARRRVRKATLFAESRFERDAFPPVAGRTALRAVSAVS